MDSVIVYHHLGLGDTIECSPIVRQYCSINKLVFIFCKKKNFFLVKELFKDLNNLQIIPITNDESRERIEVENFFKQNNNIQKIIIGHENYFPKAQSYEDLGLSCSEAFYDIAKIPYAFKYEKFKYIRDFEEENRVFDKLNPKNEKYIFVHDDNLRGFKIDVLSEYKVIKNDIEENMFNLLKILENAEEIHCMSSSFLCFIDCISQQVKFKKLFLHYNIRKVFIGTNSISKQWTIIK